MQLGHLGGKRMRISNKNLKEANRTPEDIYFNSSYTSSEAMNKLRKKYGIEHVHSNKEIDEMSLERLNYKETRDFYVKAKNGYYRIYADSDGHAEFVAGQEDPEMLKLINKIYTMHFGRVRPYDKAEVPAMGNKALKARLAQKRLVQSLFGDLVEKYDFEVEEADVDYKEADDFDDGVGEDRYIWNEEANYVKVMDKNDSENYVIFAPSGDDLAARASVYITNYSPAHLTADPYYSSPEECDYETGDIESGDWIVDNVDSNGDTSFLDAEDEKRIIAAFDKYLTDFVNNL